LLTKTLPLQLPSFLAEPDPGGPVKAGLVFYRAFTARRAAAD